MRRSVGVVAVLCGVMTGCPSEYGREGRVAEAVLKDETQNSASKCSPAEIKKFCENGQDKTLDCRRCQ